MERCKCCGQIKLGRPRKMRGRWTFLKNLKAGDAITFDNCDEHEKARDAVRYYNIPHKAFKHKDGTGYSLVISS
jgi:hypothetical protein